MCSEPSDKTASAVPSFEGMHSLATLNVQTKIYETCSFPNNSASTMVSDPEISLPLRNSTPKKIRGAVILLHGLLNPKYVMWPMQRRFQRAGYRVLNCAYRSLGCTIEQISQICWDQSQFFHDELSEEVPLYLLGHSLGSIVCRTMLAERQLPKLRRTVMLAPPNHGSHVASRMGRFVRPLVPAVDQLADRPQSFVNLLPQEFAVETGIIASDPDYVIHLQATHLSGEKDHIIEPGPHASLIFRKSVFAQSLHFFENGKFFRPLPSATMSKSLHTETGNSCESSAIAADA